MSTELVHQPTVSEQELIMHLENMGLIKDLTQGEKNTFLQIAKAYNLNPFKREIYVSKYNGQMSIITGYETYIKRAERSGVLDGWTVTTEGEVNFENLQRSTLKAIITIHRSDRKHPFVWEAEFTEYMQLKDGRLNKFWQKSKTMIKKVVMAQGFRLCFNDELGGMPYAAEETGRDTQIEDTQAEVTNAPSQGNTPTVGTTAPVTVKELKPISVQSLNKAINLITTKGDLNTVNMAKVNYLVTDEQITQLANVAFDYAKPLLKDNPGMFEVLRGYTLNDNRTSPYTEAQQKELADIMLPY